MIKINEPSPNIEYEDRLASYGIIKNNKGQIAVVEMLGWGLIFPGGKIEVDEISKDTIKRESLEEIGYEVKKLEFYEKFESYYDIISHGKLNHCHSIANFYIGFIGKKIQEPIEKQTRLHWFYPNELFGKMKLDFQNVALGEIFK